MFHVRFNQFPRSPTTIYAHKTEKKLFPLSSRNCPTKKAIKNFLSSSRWLLEIKAAFWFSIKIFMPLIRRRCSQKNVLSLWVCFLLHFWLYFFFVLFFLFIWEKIKILLEGFGIVFMGERFDGNIKIYLVKCF